MTIQTTLQTQVVDGLGSIVMTDITQDPNTSNYLREFRLFDPAGALVYTLRVVAASKVAIELTAPPQTF